MEFYLIYFILLLNNSNIKWVISLLQELLWSLVLFGSYVLLLILIDLYNIKNLFIKKHKKIVLLICVIWNLSTTIFLSIYYTFIANFLIIHKFIGIQFFIWSFNLLIISILFYYYTNNFKINNFEIDNLEIDNLKREKLKIKHKNVKNLFYIISIVCIFFSPMWVNPYLYENNNIIIMLVSIFWYYGGMLPIGIFYWCYILKNVLQN